MLMAIAKSKVSCIDTPVSIDTSEKTCKNTIESDGSMQIVCNNQRFMQTSDNDRYVLVHHEYAGLAGFEENSGSESSYGISNQITGFLTEQTVKRLAVKPSQPIDPSGLAKYAGSYNYDYITSAGGRHETGRAIVKTYGNVISIFATNSATIIATCDQMNLCHGPFSDGGRLRWEVRIYDPKSIVIAEQDEFYGSSWHDNQDRTYLLKRASK